MDWLNSALTESDEEEDHNGSKDNSNTKQNDNLNKSVKETAPFPKVVQSIETVKKTPNKNTNTYNPHSKGTDTTDSGIKSERTESKDHSTDTNDSTKDSFDDKKDVNTSNHLFSIETKTRRVENFDKVKIKSQELSESELRELSQFKQADSASLTSLLSNHRPVTQSSGRVLPSNSEVEGGSVGRNRPDYKETLDYDEALSSFNKSNVNFDKLLKSNQWLGPKVKIKDVRQEDLVQSELEKNRNYTCNREILYEGGKKFSMPTRLMETEDGQVITTNVARRTQKRKHQINWLAMEAQDKEMEIMEQTAHMRKSKRETQMKYGW